VRAGIAALVANMVLNIAILALLYRLMVPTEAKALGVWGALTQTPGLHLALGIASALASYINAGLLAWWLHRTGLYQRLPGWGPYLLRLLLACAAMSTVLLVTLHWAPDFTRMPLWPRIGWLAVVVGGGGAVYVGALLGLGLRLRHLREP
jgi:putative peptidoglycan lipid II flippase